MAEAPIMTPSDDGSLTDVRALVRAQELALDFIASLPSRPVGARADAASLLAALGGPIPASGEDAVDVVEHLARSADPGLVATAGPRFFGFVIGGSVPAARAIDSLVGTWDQNAALFAASPAAAVVEDVAAGWILDVLGLPAAASVGFVTGGQMANFTCLAAARHAVLERAGWDVERDGLIGAPRVNVVVSAESHATILAALRLVGLGSGGAIRVPTDAQGRMLGEALTKVLASLEGPTIVCAQAGNVDTGAFDELAAIGALTRAQGAWLHVDGAFGLWAAAAPDRRHLVEGLPLADSWATDAHKWLNVPYDCGIAIVADPATHHGSMTVRGAYLLRGSDGERDNHDWVPESSRRARGFVVYAALRSLGRSGVADLVERSCRLAARMADLLGEEPGITVLNDVVLNQVLLRVEPQDGRDPDQLTREAIAGIQADGTCWLGGTRWHDRQAMRISISNWSTTEADIDRSAAAIVRVVRQVLGEANGRGVRS
jgi:glutamate/tyrosine decarboxylase-like PLP-dependent enzyme